MTQHTPNKEAVEITSLHKQKKKRTNLTLDEKTFEEFKVELKKIGVSVSSMFNEFMTRVLDLLKSGEGGEVVFGIKRGESENAKG